MSQKQFVVVGGSRGIGRGIVERLSALSHSVTVLCRSFEPDSFSGSVNHVAWNATTDDFPTDQVPNEIDGVVYCPGSLNLRSFRSLKPEVFAEDFDINVVGAVNAIQGCLPALKARESASVLLFSTVAVQQGMFAHASIAASKGAIEGLTRTLAAELSPQIRVNCIAPALTNTPLTEKFFATEEKAKAMNEKYPLGRAGTVNDIAATGCFLLSEESNWITGQVIGVDGGMSSVRK